MTSWHTVRTTGNAQPTRADTALTGRERARAAVSWGLVAGVAGMIATGSLIAHDALKGTGDLAENAPHAPYITAAIGAIGLTTAVFAAGMNNRFSRIIRQESVPQVAEVRSVSWPPPPEMRRAPSMEMHELTPLHRAEAAPDRWTGSLIEQAWQDQGVQPMNHRQPMPPVTGHPS